VPVAGLRRAAALARVRRQLGALAGCRMLQALCQRARPLVSSGRDGLVLLASGSAGAGCCRTSWLCSVGGTGARACVALLCSVEKASRRASGLVRVHDNTASTPKLISCRACVAC
jgi:hypothetical protein